MVCMPNTVLLALLLVSVSVWCCHATEDTDSAFDDLDEPQLPPVPLVISRHAEGRWNVVWTSACSKIVREGGLYFKNETHQFFSWRVNEEKYDYSIAGEGTTVSYLPFLSHVESYRFPGKRKSYGYQICTLIKQELPTAKSAWTSGSVTETRVMRGFIFEVAEHSPSSVVVLDRCVDGLNRNYNLFVTTMGRPIAEGTEGPGKLSKSLHYVRWQFRLPGPSKCEPIEDPEVAAAAAAATEPYDAAADNAFDVMEWTRAELPQPSFWDEHFNMIVFAFLFIFFRVFVSYRYNSQKLQVQREFLQGVAEEEKKNKEAIIAAAEAKNKQSKRGKQQ